MKLIKDLGSLYATEKSKEKKRYGIYECPTCKKNFKTMTSNVKKGATSQCLPCGRESSRKLRIKHNITGSKIWNTFQRMRNRCYKINNKDFKYYGGRGIIICDEWLDDNMKFFKWAKNNGLDEKGTTIDRRDNNKSYSPNNCRATTRTVQSRNTRRINASNTSGYRGVSKRGTVFVASIGVDGIQVYLGRFKTAIEGSIAYDKYVIENNLEHTINGVRL